MAKVKQKPVKRLMKHGSGDTKIMRKSRIEDLKIMINNTDYVDEAIQKLANSLTSGLMK